MAAYRPDVNRGTTISEVQKHGRANTNTLLRLGDNISKMAACNRKWIVGIVLLSCRQAEIRYFTSTSGSISHLLLILLEFGGKSLN